MDINNKFEMVAKTFQGLEDILADELREIGAENVRVGRRMVSFDGDLATLYRANICCRTALRILKPIYKFEARTTEELYDRLKEFNWGEYLTLDKTFSIDTVANSDEFTHSRFVTYRAKDAIVDWFRDRFGPDSRPKVRVQDADVRLNLHIAANQVTVSLDSSGESLHKRGWRVEQTEAPINEVLAAGILLKTGWKGDTPLIDPMCGSGTFVIEAAMIAAGINPGIYRSHFAFESWPDFNGELFESIYNDDSGEREITQPIIGADISPKAIAIATRNAKSAGVMKYLDLQVKPLAQWTEEDVPGPSTIVTNPPYGERIAAPDMEGLYTMIGSKLKHVFKGCTAWIIGYHQEYFHKIGLSPSVKMTIYNGPLECELREYIIFDGTMSEFRREGGRIKEGSARQESRKTPLGVRRRNKLEERYESKRGPRKFRDRDDDGEYSGSRRRDSKPGERKEFKGGKFAKDSKFSRDSKFPRKDKEVKGPRKFRDDKEPRKPLFSDSTPAQEYSPENPLAHRRNSEALKSIVGRTPSLPEPTDHVTMRPRRGWRKKD